MEHSLSPDTKRFIVHLVHAGLKLDLETVDLLLAKCIEPAEVEPAEVETPAGMKPWRIFVPTERGGSPNYQCAWVDDDNQIRWAREGSVIPADFGFRQLFLREST